MRLARPFLVCRYNGGKSTECVSCCVVRCAIISVVLSISHFFYSIALLSLWRGAATVICAFTICVRLDNLRASKATWAAAQRAFRISVMGRLFFLRVIYSHFPRGPLFASFDFDLACLLCETGLLSTTFWQLGKPLLLDFVCAFNCIVCCCWRCC